MKRGRVTEGSTSTATVAPPAAPLDSRSAAGLCSRPAALQTEFSFTLPRGYVDSQGVVHRGGIMRLATARDELLPLSDQRVRENPAYLSVVLISRLITKLGDLTDIHAGIVEDLFAADLAFLQKFYEKINLDGTSIASTVCPDCRHEFDIDLGSRLGE
ncbi:MULTISPECIES: hypothetical protein [unclassified Streptomyces]|uniref:hypothetical protein n=1 Tax=unclassified Streptomyces TaxID=2593676 RepID=UPI0037F213C5